MGLRKCFEAADRLVYRGPRDFSLGVPLANYNNELIQSPRMFPEELYCLTVDTATPGAIWVSRENTPYSDYVINHVAIVNQVEWPSWAATKWRYDAQYGHALSRESRSDGDWVVYDAMAYSPDSAIWTFGVHADAYYGGPYQIDMADFHPIPSSALAYRDWEAALGRTLWGVADFNIDVGADLAWFRWIANNQGQVSVHRLSTKEHLADIYAPNATAGIVLCRDGWVYLRDVADWICVYDYAGTYFGAFKHPRREAYFGAAGGAIYGWDQFYRRLLFLGAVANSPNGQSRMRIKGYYPNPEPAFLTNLLPRTVPRRGRKTTIFAHLAGEGLEPLASRQAQFTGSLVATCATDNEGDAIATKTPADTSDLGVSLTVDATVPPVDTPEPNAAPTRVLVVRMTLVKDGDTARFSIASIVGAVGDVTVLYAIEGQYGSHTVTVSGAPTDPLAGSFDSGNAITDVGVTVTAFVTDSTGQLGESNTEIVSI